MSEKKELFMKYGPRNILWLMDKNNDIHLRFTAQLDHEIDGELMKKAWERTIAVYPVLNCYIEMEGKHFYIYKSQGKNEAIESKAPIMPGSDLVGNCEFTATYYGDKVSVSAYHAMVDGGGLNEIFKTLLYFYLSSYTGESDAPSSVQTVEGRRPEEYYKEMTPDDLGDFTPQPIHVMPYLREFTYDPEMAPADNGDRYVASLRFSVDSFIGRCKEIGANPSSMLCLLLSRAFYTLNPDERKDLFIEFTTSTRKIFGREGYISNHICNVLADVEYDAAVNGDPAEFVKKIRAEMDTQRSADYVKSFRMWEETYGHNYLHDPITITYFGKVDIGVNTRHITDLEMVTNAVHLLMMMQLGSDFLLLLQFGKATQKYIDEFGRLLSGMGIEARTDAGLHAIITDSPTQVL